MKIEHLISNKIQKKCEDPNINFENRNEVTCPYHRTSTSPKTFKLMIYKQSYSYELKQVKDPMFKNLVRK